MKYNKPIHVLNLSLHRVKKTNLYDVFIGLGWKNHRRVKVIGGSVSIIEGQELSSIQRAAIIKSIGGNDARG